VKVAVNLSAYQFQQPNLTDLIQAVLVETQISPNYLELEITETTVMKNVERAKLLLDQIHQLGVSIAIDDFGTGYSSLSYLKEFPFQTLKIDRSFIRDINTDPNDKAIVAAIIAMGRVLNLELVAEGVENEVQAYLLRSLGCEHMQGFWFSQPLPADQATQLLHRGPDCPIQTSLSA
jgi:EAL domain-containing protein (putative c-di-GMP-specific phosphodiesterase class I)